MRVHTIGKQYKLVKIENEPIEIVDSCNIYIEDNGKQYQVHAEYTGEHDTYMVNVYDITTEDNPIMLAEASMDSCGGGFGDEILETGIEALDNVVLEELFGKTGAIIPF